MTISTRGKLFYAEATKGYTLKVMVDSLAVSMSRTTFRMTKEGFFHRNTDENKHILTDINFPMKNFKRYICQKNIQFTLNIGHLQKLMRNVKKKDSVVLYITKKDTEKLFLAISPSNPSNDHNTRMETVFISIQCLEKQEIIHDLPEIYESEDGEVEVYDQPKVVEATDFQKMKKMTSVGKIVKVEMQGSNYISFYGDNGELYGSKLEFGEIEYDESEEENSNDSGDGEIKNWYEAEFYMSIFSYLMKLPGLCTQMQFYAPKVDRFPLKIEMQAGNLGNIMVYVKDSQQISFEETQKEQLRGEED